MCNLLSMSPSILVLAAGFGKRMHSPLPKVLIPLGGRALILHILDRVFSVHPDANVGVVVGFQADLVKKTISEHYPNRSIDFILQEKPEGTGHAAKMAMESDWGKKQIAAKTTILVLPGDLPLISDELIRDMCEPLSRGVALRMLTATLASPGGYGRVVRKGKKGAVIRIVEEKDANAREKAIAEVVLSIYQFQAQFLAVGVQEIKNTNAQKEYYLPDLVSIAVRKKRAIETLPWIEVEDVRGVNNPLELAEAFHTLNKRVIRAHALMGVRFMDIHRVVIEPTVQIAADVSIAPGALLEGNTKIAAGVSIGPWVHLKNVIVGKNAVIRAGTVAEDSEIHENAKVGPFAHLRPESIVGKGAKIGNFVELKKSTIGEDTSIAHLSYVGDATIGAHVNIGCGFVTCNFDGRVIDGQRKHKTVIEDNVFVGSDCQTVAPIVVKKGAYIASGSTITESVEEDALAIARARQVNKPGYAKKLRQK